VSVIVICEWPVDHMQIRDNVLKEAAHLTLLGRGGLLFLAVNAETGRAVAALRHVAESDASRFRQRASKLGGADNIVISAMLEQEHHWPIGLCAMFP
jgi:hypothetical protein